MVERAQVGRKVSAELWTSQTRRGRRVQDVYRAGMTISFVEDRKKRVKRGMDGGGSRREKAKEVGKDEQT